MRMAIECESQLFEKMPDLEVMVQMIQDFDQPDVVLERGLFTVFRQMQIEEDIENEDA